LVVFPTSVFPLLALSDLAYLFTRRKGAWDAGLPLAAIGLASTALAALPGFVDYLSIPRETPARRTATVHLAVGVGVLGLYALAVAARRPMGSGKHKAAAIATDLLGLAGIGLQGWLGGELVVRHSIGVLTESEGGEPIASVEPEAGRAAMEAAPTHRPVQAPSAKAGA
jgi:uncharacterized membrane protein